MQLDFAKWIADPTVRKLFELVAGLVVLQVAIRLLRRALPRYVKSPDLRYRARKLATFAGYLAAALFAVGLFSANLRQLSVAFGVAGAGIAFALQEVIASIAGWGAVAFGGFYNVGDRVQLGGIRGDVIDIGILRTTLMECGDWVRADLYNGRIVRVANSFVFKEPVFNYSGDFPFLWDEVVIPVRHGSDYRLAKEVIEGAVRSVVGGYVADTTAAWKAMVGKYRIEDARIDPVVTLVVNDNWLKFTAPYIFDYKRRRAVKDEIFVAILDALAGTEGRVSLASATFELVAAPALDIRLETRATGPGSDAGGDHVLGAS